MGLPRLLSFDAVTTQKRVFFLDYARLVRPEVVAETYARALTYAHAEDFFFRSVHLGTECWAFVAVKRLEGAREVRRLFVGGCEVGCCQQEKARTLPQVDTGVSRQRKGPSIPFHLTTNPNTTTHVIKTTAGCSRGVAQCGGARAAGGPHLHLPGAARADAHLHGPARLPGAEGRKGCVCVSLSALEADLKGRGAGFVPIS